MYAPFLIWGDGRHLRLPFLLSASTNLDFTAEQQSRQMPYAPRRATTTRNISLTLQRKASRWSQHCQPTRIHSSGFPSRPCPHVTGEPGYSGRIS